MPVGSSVMGRRRVRDERAAQTPWKPANLWRFKVGKSETVIAYVPGYWPNEVTGVLAPVVRAYLNGNDLSADDVAVLRAYFTQWIYALGFCGPLVDELRREVGTLSSRRDVTRWLDMAEKAGCDPL